MTRPRIGVTGAARGGRLTWVLTRRALRRAGADPVRLRPGHPVVVARLDGLLLGGGPDLERALVGAVPERTVATPTSPEDPPEARHRDAFERELLRRADATGIPVLGICRGAQLLNLEAGGTLWDDVAHRRPRRWPRRLLWPALPVSVRPLSRLARVLGEVRLRVNQLHHQAVRRAGEGLRVVARDPFGIVQAVESTHGPWRVGCQWHPELLPARRSSQRLFEAFVRACAPARGTATERAARSADARATHPAHPSPHPDPEPPR